MRWAADSTSVSGRKPTRITMTPTTSRASTTARLTPPSTAATLSTVFSTAARDAATTSTLPALAEGRTRIR